MDIRVRISVKVLGFKVDVELSIGLLVPNPWLHIFRVLHGEVIWRS